MGFTHTWAIRDLSVGAEEPKGVLFGFSWSVFLQGMSSSWYFALTKIKLSQSFLGTHRGNGGRAGSVDKGSVVGDVKLGQKIVHGRATA